MGVTKGVNVAVGVAVGRGVPGVFVGVGESVGVMVGMPRERVRVTPGSNVPLSSSTTTRPNAVAVGRPRGPVGPGARSQATSNTTGAATMSSDRTTLHKLIALNLNKRK